MSEQKCKTFIGYKPFVWQSVVHLGLSEYGKGSGTIHAVKAKRQIGKSFIIINELLRFSINYPNTISCGLSPTLNQARKLYKEILKVTNETGVIKKKNDSLLEIELINQSIIVFKSAEQKENLRGYTYSGILCIDEAAYISDEVYSIIKPTTDVYRTPILMVSTPRFRMGFFHDHYQMGFMSKYKGKIFSYDLCKYDTSALLSNDALEMYKTMLPKNMFTTEYLGEFLDSESIVFGDFKQCINNDVTPYNNLYIGIDWSSGVGSDSTVVCAINEHNEQVFAIAFNNKTATQQVDFIVQYLQPYMTKIKSVLSEKNGVGAPLTDALNLSLKGIRVKAWNTDNKNKIHLINQLQVAFEQNKIKILDNEEQTAQLSMYEAKVKENGTITFNAPCGAHDDYVMALMFALEARKQGSTKQYSISII